MGGAHGWSTDERRVLVELARHDDRCGERARVLLDTEGLTPTAAHGVAATTLARWRGRFAGLGAAGLVDRDRGGRPPTRAAVDLLHVLLEPTDEPWTTRRVAARAQVSQSVVARAWTTVFASSAEAEAAVGMRPVRLLGLRVDGGGSLLVLGDAPLASSAEGARRSMRHDLRLMLAMDAARPAAGTAGSAAFVRRMSTGPAGAVVVGSASRARLAPSMQVVERWGSLLDPLATRLVDPGDLRDLVEHAARWSADRPAEVFEWSTGPRPATGSAVPLPTMTRADPLEASVTAVCTALVQGGGLGSGPVGERISTTDLARLMGTSRDTARRALVRLEAEGLLLPGGGRASRLIVPTPEEVLEVYAARRSLGALLVRRAACERPAMDRTEAALEEFLRISGEGDPWNVGEADLSFQDALAHDAGAPRIARLFGRLTQQLRLFIAILGIRYSYPSAESARDARDLLAAVTAGEEHRALDVWRAKMSRAAGYMVHQLPPADRERSRGMVRSLDLGLLS